VLVVLLHQVKVLQVVLLLQVTLVVPVVAVQVQLVLQLLETKLALTAVSVHLLTHLGELQLVQVCFLQVLITLQAVALVQVALAV
jgi:hypothetical protein